LKKILFHLSLHNQSFLFVSAIPGQQNSPHSILVHPAMAAQHAANVAAAAQAQAQGQQQGGPAPQ
jgi:hypothetical protein